MRDLKYRALDENHSVLKSEHRWVYFTLEQLIDRKPVNGFGDIDKGSVCRFIGLKDKNGKEIYEHDLLLFKGQEVFCFYDDTRAIFSWAMVSEYSLWQKGHSPVGVFSIDELSRENNDELEVIGNIYEYSHLLENESKEL